MSKLPSESQVRDRVENVGNLLAHGRLLWRLLKDRRVPAWVKLVPLAGVAYLIWPIDLISDLVPGLGQLDDLGILLLSLKLFIDLSPAEVIRHHLEQMGGGRTRSGPGAEPPPAGETIDASYRIVTPEDEPGRDS